MQMHASNMETKGRKVFVGDQLFNQWRRINRKSLMQSHVGAWETTLERNPVCDGLWLLLCWRSSLLYVDMKLATLMMRSSTENGVAKKVCRRYKPMIR